MTGPRPKLYGRRKGHALSPHRSGLMAQLLPLLQLDLGTAPPQPIASLFPVPVRAVRLEIGFGGGEHLIAEARSAADIGFIGAEPFINGMGKAVAAIAAGHDANIRLHDGDAAMLLEWLPPASLERVDLLYPDPWPKKRHWKRRFVGDRNLDLIARALTPGGSFRFASDIESYVEWTLLHLLRRADFDWLAERSDDWRQPWPGWPGTRYEAKALREGRRPAYLAFRRV